jgi:hypothetical protein
VLIESQGFRPRTRPTPSVRQGAFPNAPLLGIECFHRGISSCTLHYPGSWALKAEGAYWLAAGQALAGHFTRYRCGSQCTSPTNSLALTSPAILHLSSTGPSLRTRSCSALSKTLINANYQRLTTLDRDPLRRIWRKEPPTAIL